MFQAATEIIAKQFINGHATKEASFDFSSITPSFIAKLRQKYKDLILSLSNKNTI